MGNILQSKAPQLLDVNQNNDNKIKNTDDLWVDVIWVDLTQNIKENTTNDNDNKNKIDDKDKVYDNDVKKNVNIIDADSAENFIEYKPKRRKNKLKKVRWVEKQKT